MGFRLDSARRSHSSVAVICIMGVLGGVPPPVPLSELDKFDLDLDKFIDSIPLGTPVDYLDHLDVQITPIDAVQPPNLGSTDVVQPPPLSFAPLIEIIKNDDELMARAKSWKELHVSIKRCVDGT